MTRIPTYLLNLAGEYRVCSELNKRGVFATLTYGNRKSGDLYAISDRHKRVLKVEVKTSQRGNFVTGITPRGLADGPTAPDFWVLFQIQPGENGAFKERFFVLTHQDICKIQAARNAAYDEKYFARHEKHFDFSKGPDDVRVADVEQFENQWCKIIERAGGPEVD